MRHLASIISPLNHEVVSATGCLEGTAGFILKQVWKVNSGEGTDGGASLWLAAMHSWGPSVRRRC
jgi:hypothetical protein